MAWGQARSFRWGGNHRLFRQLAGGGPSLAAPTALTAPAASAGSATVPATLTVIIGTYDGNPAPTVAGEWFRDGIGTGETGVALNATVAGSYDWREVATNSQGSAPQQTSNAVVLGAALAAPTALTAPSASADAATVPATLTVTIGTYDGNPVPTVAGQWFRDGVPTGVVTTTLNATVAGSYEWRETASNSQGSAPEQISTAVVLTVPLGWTDTQGIVWRHAFDYTAADVAAQGPIPALTDAQDLDFGSLQYRVAGGPNSQGIGLSLFAIEFLQSGSHTFTLPENLSALGSAVSARFIVRPRGTASQVYRIGSDGVELRVSVSSGTFSAQIYSDAGVTLVATATVASLPAVPDRYVVDVAVTDNGGAGTRVELRVGGALNVATAAEVFTGLSGTEFRVVTASVSSANPLALAFFGLRSGATTATEHTLGNQATALSSWDPNAMPTLAKRFDASQATYSGGFLTVMPDQLGGDAAVIGGSPSETTINGRTAAHLNPSFNATLRFSPPQIDYDETWFIVIVNGRDLTTGLTVGDVSSILRSHIPINIGNQGVWARVTTSWLQSASGYGPDEILAVTYRNSVSLGAILRVNGALEASRAGDAGVASADIRLGSPQDTSYLGEFFWGDGAVSEGHLAQAEVWLMDRWGIT